MRFKESSRTGKIALTGPGGMSIRITGRRQMLQPWIREGRLSAGHAVHAPVSELDGL